MAATAAGAQQVIIETAEIQVSNFLQEFRQSSIKFRSRVDLTDKMQRLPQYRRLDSLARLLESVTNCVAVAVVNNEFLIAANKIDGEPCEQRTDDLRRLINEVMRYFQTIARSGPLDDTERRRIFNLLCAPERFIALIKGSKMNVTTRDVTDITEKILMGRRFSIKEALDEYGRDISVAVIAMVCQDLYYDFKKIENGLLKASKDDFSKITREQFRAFQNGIQRIFIPGPEFPNGRLFHAEMQIVFYVLDSNFPGLHYIGISKLCCLNCHVMLSVVNELRREQKFSFLVRGWHDGIDSAAVPEKILQRYQDIQVLYDQLIKTERKEVEAAKQKKTGVPQQEEAKGAAARCDRSDSSASQAGVELVEDNKHKLLIISQIFERIDAGLTLNDARIMAIIGSCFCGEEIVKHYETLFDRNLKEEQEELKPKVQAFMQALSLNATCKKIMLEQDNLFLRFFNSPFFDSPIQVEVSEILQQEFPVFRSSLSRSLPIARTSGADGTLLFDCSVIRVIDVVPLPNMHDDVVPQQPTRRHKRCVIC